MDKQSSTNNVLVLEYANQGSLLNYLQTQHPEIMIKRTLFQQVTQALEYLHTQGIAHRDIKLENVLVFQEDGEVCAKVSDFGFATRFLRKGQIVRFGEYKGTRKGYMAPEIHRCREIKDNQYDADKTDIFALGVVLFALVMGTLPFQLAVEQDRLYRLVAQKKWQDFWKCHMVALQKL